MKSSVGAKDLALMLRENSKFLHTVSGLRLGGGASSSSDDSLSSSRAAAVTSFVFVD